MSTEPTVIQTLGGETVTRSPEPGEVWVGDSESLTNLYIAQEGRKAIRITLRKSTGKVIQIDMEGWITQDCKPFAEASHV